jgi:hypothetical protein
MKFSKLANSANYLNEIVTSSQAKDLNLIDATITNSRYSSGLSGLRVFLAFWLCFGFVMKTLTPRKVSYRGDENCLFHSYRNASTGSSFAACIAGNHPLITPTTTRIIVDKNKVVVESAR